MNAPDLASLKEDLSYDPSSGLFTRLSAGARAGEIAGTLGRNGYIYIRLRGRHYLAHRLAWLFMTGSMPDGSLDHINNIPTDNRFENLRQATKSQNGCNRGPNKNNTSGFKGVHWYKARNKWCADIWIEGAKKHLGYFKNIEDAAEAYRVASIKYHGEFSRIENEHRPA